MAGEKLTVRENLKLYSEGSEKTESTIVKVSAYGYPVILIS